MVKLLFRPDYYEILQISHQADSEVIRAAYRILGKKYHPDNKIDGDEAKMKLINEAHDVLNDKTTRQQYDQWLEAETQKSRQQRMHQYDQSTSERSKRNNNQTEPKTDEPGKAVFTNGSMYQWIFSKRKEALIGTLMILCAGLLGLLFPELIIGPLVGVAGMATIYFDNENKWVAIPMIFLAALVAGAIILLIGLTLNGIQHILP